MTSIQLSVEESLTYAKESSYWDGFAAGTRYAAEHAKELAIRKLADSHKGNVQPIKAEA